MVSMTPDQITETARRIRAVFEDSCHGSEGDWTMGGDTYKPFYRAIAYVVGGGRTSITEKVSALGRTPTRDETFAILCALDPFFVDALERDLQGFEFLYENHAEVWSDPDFW